MRWAAITRPNPLYGAVRWLRRNTASEVRAGRQAGGRSECPQGAGTLTDCQGHGASCQCKRSGRYARRSRNGLRRKPDSSMVGERSSMLKAGRGRRVRFRGLHRRAAHRRDADWSGASRASAACLATRSCRAQEAGQAVLVRLRCELPNARRNSCCNSRSSVPVTRRR